jgi:O-antigen biosynthesis protein WbqP
MLIAFFILITSNRPILYWSDRIGKDNFLFRMPKFRTMWVSSPEVATHLLINSPGYLTPIGSFLRKLSLDELPQLISICKGDMSLVGPRPALHNQYDLISLRTSKGIHTLKPGLTGWAQVNCRDEISIFTKVKYDEYYLFNQSILFDMKIILKTFFIFIKSFRIII